MPRLSSIARSDGPSWAPWRTSSPSLGTSSWTTCGPTTGGHAWWAGLAVPVGVAGASSCPQQCRERRRAARAGFCDFGAHGRQCAGRCSTGSPQPVASAAPSRHPYAAEAPSHSSRAPRTSACACLQGSHQQLQRPGRGRPAPTPATCPAQLAPRAEPAAARRVHVQVLAAAGAVNHDELVKMASDAFGAVPDEDRGTSVRELLTKVRRPAREGDPGLHRQRRQLYGPLRAAAGRGVGGGAPARAGDRPPQRGAPEGSGPEIARGAEQAPTGRDGGR
jgi:hypothetical protein